MLGSVLDYSQEMFENSLIYFQITNPSFLIYSYTDLLGKEGPNVERHNREKMHTP